MRYRYGDMRLPVMDHFKKVWNVLGPRQTLFIKVPASGGATAARPTNADFLNDGCVLCCIV